MAYPGFAEIANRTDHAQTGGKNARMFDHTVTSLQHAFDFAALRTNRKALHTLAEVAEGTGLLFSLALVALQMEMNNGMSLQTFHLNAVHLLYYLHCCIARHVRQ